MTVLTELPLHDGAVVLRTATAADVPAVVRLLAADQLGATRDGAEGDEAMRPFLSAFRSIDADPAHLLIVAGAGADVVGTLQLSVLPGLARRRGCVLVQLTTDKSRIHAHRFYARLGFSASHEGSSCSCDRRRHSHTVDRALPPAYCDLTGLT